MGMKKLVRQGHLLIYNGLVSLKCRSLAPLEGLQAPPGRCFLR
jgi:hypothetical protein